MGEAMKTFKIAFGALAECPIYETHNRGKNWLAKISVDPTVPGGFAREFARRAHGDFFYMIPSWAVPGTPIEFGADYYSARGAKKACRFYGVIETITPDVLTVEECNTGKDACAKALKIVRKTFSEYQQGVEL